MALASVHQQALEAVQRSSHTLICFGEHVRGDGVGTAMALAAAFEKIKPGLRVDIASSGFTDAHRARER